MMAVATPLLGSSSGPALHIPDGFLSAPIAIAGYVITAGVVALAVRNADRRLDERAVPLMGIMAAFIFAAQMMNFPVAGGTSGHMLGGALAAILLGPWAAIIVMAAVVGLQALLFQDGGVVVLGVNVLNMGILTAFVGFGVYRAVLAFSTSETGRLVGGFAAAWLSVQVAALATTLQLVASDTTTLEVALPAMLGVHALIGLGEGLVTVATLGFIRSTRPDLLGVAPAAGDR